MVLWVLPVLKVVDVQMFHQLLQVLEVLKEAVEISLQACKFWMFERWLSVVLDAIEVVLQIP